MQTKTIPLSAGYEATVDQVDYERVNQYKWTTAKRGDKVYAYRWLKNEFGVKISVYLHRFILDVHFLPKQIEVDHIDGNGLNCTRLNLRPVTSSQNKCNRGKQRDNKSGHKGVIWHKGRNKWFVQLSVGGRRVYTKYFTNLDEAAQAYKDQALIHHGEYANF